MRFANCKRRAAALAAAALLFGPAAPVAADPVVDPCQLAVSLFCRMVPIAPELEHSVDLTQNQPPADPAAPLPEDFVPAPPCAAGCV